VSRFQATRNSLTTAPPTLNQLLIQQSLLGDQGTLNPSSDSELL